MIRLLFLLLSLFTTEDEKKLAKDHYSGTTISDRYYWNGRGSDFRFYIDKTMKSGNQGNSTLWMFHFEGWVQGLGYEHGFYLGRTAKYIPDGKGGYKEVTDRFFIFAFNHTKRWDGVEAEIQRGK